MKIEIYSNERIKLILGKRNREVPIVLVKLIRIDSQVKDEIVSYLHLKEISKYKISKIMALIILRDYSRTGYLDYIGHNETYFPKLIYKGELEYENKSRDL